MIFEDDDAIFFTLKELLAMDGFSINRAATISDAEKIRQDSHHRSLNGLLLGKESQK